MRAARLVLVFFLLPVAGPAAAAELPDAARLAERIDQALAGRWAKASVEPARRSDDAEFLRRAYLDLTGRIPPVSEVRRFLADPAPDKRAALVERLLNDPGYATYFATPWRHLLVPDADDDPGRQPAVAALEAWLRVQFAASVPTTASAARC